MVPSSVKRCLWRCAGLLTLLVLTACSASQTVRYQPSDESFPNPERGWLVTYDIADYPMDLGGFYRRGVTLVRAYVSLADFRDAPLSDEFLARLQKGFDGARQGGVKLILRFTYNDGEGRSTVCPDAPLELMLAHIAQLKPLLQANADVIAVMQQGFIGCWGEGHTSEHLPDWNEDPAGLRAQVYAALLDALPPSRFIQLRYPAEIRALYGEPVSAQEAYSGADKARVGHHNQCFLASDDDWGTYWTGPNWRANLKEWKDYVERLTTYTPMGGETCNVDRQRNACPVALEELARFHYSYLNRDYNKSVYGIWKEQGCFDEIDRRLGYRLTLIQATLPRRAAPGRPLTVRIELRNDGFAPLYNARPVYLTLINEQSRRDLLLTNVDPRRWEAGQTTVIEASVVVPPDLPAGRYRLALWLPDADERLRDRPAYAVRLANQNVWDAETGLNILSESLKIR